MSGFSIDAAMQDSDQSEYFERRAEEERAAADRAADERAAQSHRELANRYEKASKGGESSNDAEEAGDSATVHNEFRIIP